jgi:hypothetical protein
MDQIRSGDEMTIRCLITTLFKPVLALLARQHKKPRLHPFWRLPLELRELIYEYLALTAVIKLDHSVITYTNANILRTCHRAAVESQKIIYKTSTIRCTFHGLIELIKEQHPVI